MEKRQVYKECPWCGEEFETENERGVHISRNHVDTQKNIPKPNEKRNSKKSLVDAWQKSEA